MVLPKGAWIRLKGTFNLRIAYLIAGKLRFDCLAPL
jgi:hypothetical protein